MVSRLSLLGKLNIIVALVFLVVTTVETVISVQQDKARFLAVAEEQVTDMTRWYFDSLNTMMLTGSMNQRALLREKLTARSQVLEARVIRGKPVKQQFGDGFPDEQPVDELDHRGLDGESSIVVTKGVDGRELTVVTPFRATENTRGVNC
ncbi:MAG: methyl-accepting chemotaxis protein, partial [Gammaproteobacteria bacterium]|nr:methyl-accepting chemotaxis protein [Gammaproteobacteria bacterium]